MVIIRRRIFIWSVKCTEAAKSLGISTPVLKEQIDCTQAPKYSVLDPDLRVNEKREFFTLDPENAYALLYSIAKIHGRTDKLIDGPGRNAYICESTSTKRTNLPRMKWCMDNGLIKVGDKVYIKGNEEETATVIDDKKVNYKGEEMTFNDYGCKIMEWTSIQIYSFLIVVGEKKTLGEKRQEKMDELGLKP